MARKRKPPGRRRTIGEFETLENRQMLSAGSLGQNALVSVSPIGADSPYAETTQAAVADTVIDLSEQTTSSDRVGIAPRYVKESQSEFSVALQVNWREPSADTNAGVGIGFSGDINPVFGRSFILNEWTPTDYRYEFSGSTMFLQFSILDGEPTASLIANRVEVTQESQDRIRSLPGDIPESLRHRLIRVEQRFERLAEVELSMDASLGEYATFDIKVNTSSDRTELRVTESGNTVGTIEVFEHIPTGSDGTVSIFPGILYINPFSEELLFAGADASAVSQFGTVDVRESDADESLSIAEYYPSEDIVQGDSIVVDNAIEAANRSEEVFADYMVKGEAFDPPDAGLTIIRKDAKSTPVEQIVLARSPERRGGGISSEAIERFESREVVKPVKSNVRIAPPLFFQAGTAVFVVGAVSHGGFLSRAISSVLETLKSVGRSSLNRDVALLRHELNVFQRIRRPILAWCRFANRMVRAGYVRSWKIIGDVDDDPYEAFVCNLGEEISKQRESAELCN